MITLSSSLHVKELTQGCNASQSWLFKLAHPLLTSHLGLFLSYQASCMVLQFGPIGPWARCHRIFCQLSIFLEERYFPLLTKWRIIFAQFSTFIMNVTTYVRVKITLEFHFNKTRPKIEQTLSVFYRRVCWYFVMSRIKSASTRIPL